MKRKVVIAVGGYGYRPDPEGAVMLITADDGPIEVEDKEAERLIGLGVAKAYEESEEQTEHLDKGQFDDYSVKELRELAKEMGITGGSRMNREELIDKISSKKVEIPDNTNDEMQETAEDAEDEEPPVLEAAEPEA